MKKNLPIPNNLISSTMIMGIVNVTPDSFFSSSRNSCVRDAIKHAYKLLNEGADIIDIGGESTRPGALSISVDEEINRITPVIKELIGCGALISVDTYKPAVINNVIDLGVDIINDVSGFNQIESINAILKSNCKLCIMHGYTSGLKPGLCNSKIITEMIDFFHLKIQQLKKFGVKSDRIILDPGFGFGKNIDQNYHVLSNLVNLKAFNLPIMIGISRKSMIALGNDKAIMPDSRLAGSIAASVFAYANGASIFRVHDVFDTIQALKIWEKIHKNKGELKKIE